MVTQTPKDEMLAERQEKKQVCPGDVNGVLQAQG